ncbi:MAG: hypothetical protein LUI87_04820, partial [Lachnospiraceae bacterium]|nr:hypothetical protein [Lachnospiraceae bacterium]
MEGKTKQANGKMKKRQDTMKAARLLIPHEVRDAHAPQSKIGGKTRRGARPASILALRVRTCDTIKFVRNVLKKVNRDHV